MACFNQKLLPDTMITGGNSAQEATAFALRSSLFGARLVELQLRISRRCWQGANAATVTVRLLFQGPKAGWFPVFPFPAPPLRLEWRHVT